MENKEFQKKINEDKRIHTIEVNALIDIFNKMVDKYGLKDFVRQVEMSHQNAFAAIIPFISDPDDAANYQSHLISNF